MKLTPAAATRTRTWPGPGTAASRSSTARTSRPPWRVTIRALVMATTLRAQGEPRQCRGVEPVAHPVGGPVGTEGLIEPDRRRVPGEHGPVEAGPAALGAPAGEVTHQGQSDSAAAVSG